MRRPRLLVIGPTPPPHHGIATFMERLLKARALHEAFEVSHLDISDRRDLSNLGQLDPRNVWLGIRHAAELKYRLIRDRPELVYFEVSQNAWAYLRDSQFIALPRMFGAKVATRLNGSDFRNFYQRTNAPLRAWMRSTLKRLDGVAVLGSSLLPVFEGLVASDRLAVVPNGTADSFPEAVDRQPADDRAERGDPLTVTYLGALYQPKGILDFVDAARLCRDRGLPARFVAAGGWFDVSTRAALERAVERAGLQETIEFPGIVAGDEKRALLRRTDVLVFPGIQNEGQPYVILEAMAAGLPVISTAKGAIEDMVVHGTTGWIVPERSPAAIAARLAHLHAAPDQRRALGRAGRERFVERFTDERTLADLIGWLLNVAHGRAAIAADGARVAS
jgi:glycosyltransferase involved in cell wall biosynthesis